jgi:hypothetical protein
METGSPYAALIASQYIRTSARRYGGPLVG